MKRIFVMILVSVFLMAGIAYAQPKSNASPATVVLTYESTTSLYKNITFPYPTRDLVVRNNRSDRYVYVDVHSDSNATDTSSCYLLAPETSLELYDYITDGITLIWASPPVVSASDVSVLSVY